MVQVTLEHRTSRAIKIVQATLVGDHYLLHWPLAGDYILRRAKSGMWRSSPTSLLQVWSMSPESIKELDTVLAAGTTKRREEQRKLLFKG